MFKKLISLLMVISLLTLCIGCGTATAPTTTETTTTTVAASVTEAATTTTANAATDAAVVSAEKKKVAVFLSDLINPFYQQMIEAGDKAVVDYAAAGYPEIELNWFSYDGAIDKEISLIEDCIVQGYDALIIEPIDTTGLIPVVNKATDAGIIVINCGGIVEGTDNYSSIYHDRIQCYTSGMALCTALDGKEGTIGIISGVAGNWTMEERLAGFTEAISGFPNLKYDVQLTNQDNSKATTITETWLQSDDIIGILTISDIYSLLSMAAAESAGRSDLIWASNDGQPEVYDAIREGKMLCSQLIGGYRCGYWNIAAAIRLVAGEEMPKIIYMSATTVMSDVTASMLAGKGYTVDYITPDAAEQIYLTYADEFNPSQDVSAISGQ